MIFKLAFPPPGLIYKSDIISFFILFPNQIISETLSWLRLKQKSQRPEPRSCGFLAPSST